MLDLWFRSIGRTGAKPLVSDMLDKCIACEDEQQQGRLQGDRCIQPIPAVVDAYLPASMTLLQAKRRMVSTLNKTASNRQPMITCAL